MQLRAVLAPREWQAAVPVFALASLLVSSACATIAYGPYQDYEIDSSPGEARVTAKQLTGGADGEAAGYRARESGPGANLVPSEFAAKETVASGATPNYIRIPRPGKDLAERDYALIFEKDGFRPTVKITTGYRLEKGCLFLAFFDVVTVVPEIINLVQGTSCFSWDPPKSSVTLTPL